MRTLAPARLPIFRSDLQAEILRALLLDPTARLTARELRERTGASPAGLHRELARLTEAGLVARVAIGRANVFFADRDSPLHEPLRTLVERALGAQVEVRCALEGVGRLRAAAIFGSSASDTAVPDSDIDLLAVGEAPYADVLAALRPAERRLGRAVDLKLYRPREWRARVANPSGFVQSLLDGPLLMVIGGESDLR